MCSRPEGLWQLIGEATALWSSLSPVRGAMMKIISLFDDRELIYFDPQRYSSALYNQKPSAFYVLCSVCLFFLILLCDLLCLGEICVLDWCERLGLDIGVVGFSDYLTSDVFMVYCTCQFRCLYFTHFQLRFCEAIEQTATVTLQVLSAFVQ